MRVKKSEPIIPEYIQILILVTISSIMLVSVFIRMWKRRDVSVQKDDRETLLPDPDRAPVIRRVRSSGRFLNPQEMESNPDHQSPLLDEEEDESEDRRSQPLLEEEVQVIEAECHEVPEHRLRRRYRASQPVALVPAVAQPLIDRGTGAER